MINNVIIVFWIIFICVPLTLLNKLDWNHGISRAVIVVFTLVAGTQFQRAIKFVHVSDKKNTRLFFVISLAVFVAAVSFHLNTGAKSIVRTQKTDQILLDQGQNVYRAIRLMEKGINPYESGIMLDVAELKQLTSKYSKEIYPKVSNPMQHIKTWWNTLDMEKMELGMPGISNNARQTEVQSAFNRLGIKYGPVTIAAYLPFVLLFGKVGIFAGQTFYFTGLLTLLAYWVYPWLKKYPMLTFVPFIPVLFTWHINHNVLYLSALDMPPTLLALMGLTLIFKNREKSGVILIGLSCAAKLLPGLLYTPLLLKVKKRYWPLFFSTAVLPFLPFVIRDYEGIVNNIIVYNLVRQPDSTSPVYYMSQNFQLPWLIFVVFVLFIIMIRIRNWTPENALGLIWAAHAGVFITGKIFHNNYLVWLLPIIGLYMFETLKQKLEKSTIFSDGLLKQNYCNCH